nr:hypothetical protein HK105_002264 [Polyrhizophydium stewartii]
MFADGTPTHARPFRQIGRKRAQLRNGEGVTAGCHSGRRPQNSAAATDLPYKAATMRWTRAAGALVSAALAAAVAAQSSWQNGPCTYHPYEEDMARLGSAYDNSPAWCGFRYSALNVARIVSVNGMGDSQCGQCLEFRNAAGGPSVFVLAVDQKGAAGLDISRSSFSAAFPGQNPLDPQTCAWRIVDPSNCVGICSGLECATPGRRNMLPASLLPPVNGPPARGAGVAAPPAAKAESSKTPPGETSAPPATRSPLPTTLASSTSPASSAAPSPSQSPQSPSRTRTSSMRSSPKSRSPRVNATQAANGLAEADLIDSQDKPAGQAADPSPAAADTASPTAEVAHAAVGSQLANAASKLPGGSTASLAVLAVGSIALLWI